MFCQFHHILLFYLSDWVSILLIAIFLFEIIYEIDFFFQFHPPSIFLFVGFGPHSFNKLENKSKH
jgi:hypothetical protein